MRRLLQACVVGGCLTAFALFASWHLTGGLRRKISEPRTGVPWSTDAQGQLAAVMFLERLGIEVQPFRRPLTHLRDPGALICVQTESTYRLELREAQALLDWVRRGNTLVLYTERTNALLKLLGARVVVGDDADRAWYASNPRLPLLAGANRPSGGDESWRLLWTTRIDRYPLYARGEGVTAAYLALGEGELLLFLSPHLVSNAGLLDRDNAALLRNIAREHLAGRQVYIDEFHAGREHTSTFWQFLVQLGLPVPLLAYAALVLLLLAWRLRMRFGRPVRRPEELSREGTEFARARADIHWQLRHVGLVARDLRRRLTGALLQVAPDVVGPDARLRAERLEQHAHRLPVEEVARLQAELAGLGEGELVGLRLASLTQRTEALCERILRCDS